MPIFIAMFDRPEEVTPSGINGRVFRFPFAVVSAHYFETPLQTVQTRVARITVEISATQLAQWKLSDADLRKALFQVAKEHLQAQFKRGMQMAHEITVKVNSYSHPKSCPFDLNLIEEPNGTVIQFEATQPIGFV